MNDPKYDVAISFAEEDLNIALCFYLALKKYGGKRKTVFYYKRDFNQIGKSLTKELPKIYGKNSKFVLMLVSEQYIKKEKKYAQIEAKSIVDRWVNEKDNTFFIPIIIDRTNLSKVDDRLVDDIAYIRWNHNPEILASYVWNMLGKPAEQAKEIAKKENPPKPVFKLNYYSVVTVILLAFLVLKSFLPSHSNTTYQSTNQLNSELPLSRGTMLEQESIENLLNDYEESTPSGFHLRNGMFYNQTNRPLKAIEEFKAALKLDSKNDSGHYQLGMTYLKVEDDKDKYNARRSLKRSMDLGNNKACIAYKALLLKLKYIRKSRCNNGTLSDATGRGACSHNGGVKRIELVPVDVSDLNCLPE